MSSDEEVDFMSDAFLADCVKEDIRPGLIMSSAKRRQIEQEKKRKEANMKHKEANKPKRLVEKEKREEGLSSQISADNKGFAMLQKMGFKSGMGLGKSGEGRKEPIGLEIKTGRGGLGQETERKERVQAFIKREMNKMMNEKEDLKTYRERMREKVFSRQSTKDLRISQRACRMLDQNKGIEAPEDSWYWPEEHKAKEEVDSDDEGEGPSRGTKTFQSEEDEEEEEDDDYQFCDEMCEYDDETKLIILTRYLRNTYFYCVWCGTGYDDEKDLKENCPGPTNADHT